MSGFLRGLFGSMGSFADAIGGIGAAGWHGSAGDELQARLDAQQANMIRAQRDAGYRQSQPTEEEKLRMAASMMNTSRQCGKTAWMKATLAGMTNLTPDEIVIDAEVEKVKPTLGLAEQSTTG